MRVNFKYSNFPASKSATKVVAHYFNQLCRHDSFHFFTLKRIPEYSFANMEKLVEFLLFGDLTIHQHR